MRNEDCSHYLFQRWREKGEENKCRQSAHKIVYLFVHKFWCVNKCIAGFHGSMHHYLFLNCCIKLCIADFVCLCENSTSYIESHELVRLRMFFSKRSNFHWNHLKSCHHLQALLSGKPFSLMMMVDEDFFWKRSDRNQNSNRSLLMQRRSSNQNECAQR